MSNSTSFDSINPLRTDDFLPPVGRWLSLGGLVLIGTIGIVTILATVTKYNVAVKANATVRPDGELRVVQSEVEGTVRQIMVQENQQVNQGEPIAYLDDSKLQIQKSQLQSSIQQNQLQLTQLEGQVKFLDAQILAETQSMDRSVAVTQVEMNRNQREYEERYQTTMADYQEAEVALALAQDEMKRYQLLVEAGAASQFNLNEKVSAFRAAQVRLNRANAALNPSNAAVTISQQQAAQEQARGAATQANLNKEREALNQRRSEIQNQLIREQKELEKIEQELQQMVIRASSDGIVFKLNLLNPSQVIQSGDSIAQIAPANTPLVIKAMVANQDIDQVSIGQTAQVRINACPYPDYGVLQGQVTAVAPDAGVSEANSTKTAQTSNSGSNGDRSFEVIIQPAHLSLSQGQQQCQIQAGMEASASIISRQETVLQFVLRRLRLASDL